jgi:hypothetical protein
MEISDQQNAPLGSKARIEILNEHNEPSWQTNLCSEELFPPELPTAYAGAVNITSFMEGSSPLPEPFNFTTHPLAGGSTAPLRSTSPPLQNLQTKAGTARTFLTDEKVRKEGAKRQKQFRERQRQGQEEVQRQLDDLATQIEAASVEQESLLTSNRVLTKAAEYCLIAFQAAQAVVSAMDKVQTEYSSSLGKWWASLVEGLIQLGLQVHSPSDSQLHAFLDKKTLVELDVMSEKVRKRTLEMHTRWLNEPDARASIEIDLGRVRQLRLRSMAYLSMTRTDIASEMFCRRLMPTGPNGEPHPKLVAAVEELEFTPEQLESFKENWRIYLETTESIRQEVRSTINDLSSSDFKENAEAYSSTGAAGVLLHRLQEVGELTLYRSKEAKAIGQLCIWFQREITFQQESCLIRQCAPFYPDAIQLGRIIFGDKDAGQTWQVESVQTTEFI